MKAYHGMALLALLGLGGCSCHRQPDADTPDPSVTTGTRPSPSAGDATTPVDADATSRLRELRAQANAGAVSVVQRYLTIWPGDPQEADRLWVGGQAPPVRDDANLRALQGLVSMRVRNDEPIAMDREDPPRAMEVPVHVSVQMPDGNRRFNGWYRVRPRVDGSGWELTSASLQPELD